MFKGHCLCDQVRFEFDTQPTDVSICHCSLCRRMTGTAFGVYVKVPASDLTFTSSAGQITAYNVSDKLSMCSCRGGGSYLYAKHSDYSDFVYVCLGAVDDHGDIHPGYHEFVGSKAGWFEVHDSLPQFEGWSPDE